MTRPGWDEYFMEITRLVARRSSCLRRQVGAVLVKERNYSLRRNRLSAGQAERPFR
jgi:deoxycytidylate deaminase